MQDEIMENQNAIEGAFWFSLTTLSDTFGLGLCADALEWAADYPENVALAYEKASEALSQKRSDLNLVIAESDGLPPALTVFFGHQTEYTAYFFEIQSLWERLHKKKLSGPQKAANKLSLSALAYLRQVVGINGYWNESEIRWAIEWNIEMKREDEEQDEQERQSKKDEIEFYEVALAEQTQKGLLIDKMASETGGLAGFEAHYKALLAIQPTYKRKGGLGVKTHKKLLAAAHQLLQLYRDYPTRSYLDSFKPGDLGEDDDCVIGPDSRMGFLWNQQDWMNDFVHEHLETEINSGAGVIEPGYCHHFSSPLPAGFIDDTFDKRLFAALEQLHELI